jgi:hypothetical protein
MEYTCDVRSEDGILFTQVYQDFTMFKGGGMWVEKTGDRGSVEAFAERHPDGTTKPACP